MGATKVTWLGDKGTGMRSWSCPSCSLSTILAATQLISIRRSIPPLRRCFLSLPLPIFYWYIFWRGLDLSNHINFDLKRKKNRNQTKFPSSPLPVENPNTHTHKRTLNGTVETQFRSESGTNDQARNDSSWSECFCGAPLVTAAAKRLKPSSIRLASYIYWGMFTHMYTHTHTDTRLQGYTHTHTHTLIHRNGERKRERERERERKKGEGVQSSMRMLIDRKSASSSSWLAPSNCKWGWLLKRKVDSLQLMRSGWLKLSKLNEPAILIFNRRILTCWFIQSQWVRINNPVSRFYRPTRKNSSQRRC